MNKKCIGCGALLQSEDKNEVGYVSSKVIDTAKYCERCFKVIHYNEKIITRLDNINEELIDFLKNFDGSILFLVDFFNICYETINIFNRINGKKYLVISKYDLLPKSFNDKKIVDYLRSNYNINEDIYFLSTKKNINTKSILKILEEQGENRICITGYTNAGKSTFINKILENNDIEGTITTSLNPNTTVDFMKFDVGNLTIFDSPGFVLDNDIYNDYELIRKINPKRIIDPITYQVKDVSNIIIEDLFRINSDKVNSLTFYMSNELDIKRVFETDVLKDNYKVFHIEDNQDIVIKGLGFINVKKECNVTIYSNYLDCIEIRNAMF